MEPVAVLDFCSTCGHDLRQLRGVWPKECPNTACKTVHYHPVHTVVLGLIYDDQGPLIIQRGIEPGKGGWAFPGGYQNYGETIEQAAIREIWEEIGITVEPAALQYFGSALSNTGNKSLVFFVARVPDLEQQPRRLCPTETLDSAIATTGSQLCFPSHQDMLAKFFETHAR